jgi:hypothetical protein
MIFNVSIFFRSSLQKQGRKNMPDILQDFSTPTLLKAMEINAHAMGYRIGTLQSTQMGLHIYQRLGFKEYCAFRAYFWQE